MKAPIVVRRMDGPVPIWQTKVTSPFPTSILSALQYPMLLPETRTACTVEVVHFTRLAGLWNKNRDYKDNFIFERNEKQDPCHQVPRKVYRESMRAKIMCPYKVGCYLVNWAHLRKTQ
ncbi:hypothetical protein GDO81_020378 [Engystomops pustulosus]|uniref:Uncharacterized protein n=1 Tax=Engystomops pustulosus TaxID=76066 RepID=A0AAV6ZEG7_ENGPU|nr:hypothetical protein GDO81_020378 [Engystomops pustulosus]